METICDRKGKELAIILDEADYLAGTDKKFFSDANDVLQVGSLFFGRNSDVRPHLHKNKQFAEGSMEFILVMLGDPQVDIYDSEKKLVRTIDLRVGHILIQKRGGHGFRFSSEGRLLEVKSGPYFGREADKEMI